MAMLMLFQGSKHDKNRVQMAGGPRGANCTSQTSPQVSRKLGDRLTFQLISTDGALLLHGSDRGHHPELDHLGSAEFSAGVLRFRKPTGKRIEPNRNRLGYQGPLQIRRPLKLRSWVNASAAHPQAGAQKILGTNGRSVTRAFPTTGKPVDRQAYFFNLRKCAPVAQFQESPISFPQSEGKPGSKQKASDVARNLVYLPSRERDARVPRQDARDALRAANESTHLLPWRHR